MTVVKGSSKAFIPAPEGTHQAVCVDVVDMPEQETPWGPKDKLRITWQIEQRVTEEDFYNFHGRHPSVDESKMLVGKRYAISQFFTASFGTPSKPSNLRKTFQSWRGSKVTPEEDQNGFDFEKMIGANCMLQVIHNEPTPGKLYANVVAIMPIHKSTPKMAPEDYVRAKDREKKEDPKRSAAPGDSYASDPPNDDDIPF